MKMNASSDEEFVKGILIGVEGDKVCKSDLMDQVALVLNTLDQKKEWGLQSFTYDRHALCRQR